LDQWQSQFQTLLHEARLKQLRILFFGEEFSRQQIQSRPSATRRHGLLD
jgi:hypothetical protein